MTKVPLIKEHRVLKLIEVLKCIDEYPYDREKQRDSILRLYPGRTEKSVFRGMVIPSLRQLGLILGYGNAIRLSSNGKIIVESLKESREEVIRVSSAIFLEIDKKTFGLIKKLKKKPNIILEEFVNLVCQEVEGDMSQKQKKERIESWLEILKGCGLFELKNKALMLSKNYESAAKDLNYKTKRRFFKGKLFQEYESLPRHETVGIVDIALLRELVAIKFYKDHNMVLTESQFDELLREIPLVTGRYVISLGQPMGAEEKLFLYKGNYYRTVSIKFSKR